MAAFWLRRFRIVEMARNCFRGYETTLRKRTGFIPVSYPCKNQAVSYPVSYPISANWLHTWFHTLFHTRFHTRFRLTCAGSAPVGQEPRVPALQPAQRGGGQDAPWELVPFLLALGGLARAPLQGWLVRVADVRGAGCRCEGRVVGGAGGAPTLSRLPQRSMGFLKKEFAAELPDSSPEAQRFFTRAVSYRFHTGFIPGFIPEPFCSEPDSPDPPSGL